MRSRLADSAGGWDKPERQSGASSCAGTRLAATSVGVLHIGLLCVQKDMQWPLETDLVIAKRGEGVVHLVPDGNACTLM